ncbi:MAG: thermonuclease family protein [Rhodospirillales bacterium]|nr:thermonuclease family protein [Rhodospirillales bacterium]
MGGAATVRRYVLAALWLAAIAMPSLAEDVFIGVASVIDGDTIEVHGQRIRLHGIDAPESRQACRAAGGGEYRCGQQAALALAERIGRRVVRCEGLDVDRYKRVIAVCRLDGTDLNAWMVSEGLALAYRQYSRDYIDQEDAAKAARRGLWAGTFRPPWEWRKKKK